MRALPGECKRNSTTPVPWFDCRNPVECSPVRADRIRSIHEKKRPNQSGDWLARFPEGGQTFPQYVQLRGNQPLRDRYSSIDVQPLGEFDEVQRKIIERTAECMGYFFGVPVRLRDPKSLGEIPSDARRTRDDGNEQVLTTWISDNILKPSRPDDALAVIGLVTCDLYTDDLNWVFGAASLTERVGVWSLHRNGDPRSSEESYRLCLRRTLKTALHETGHMLGIPHCSAYECCMNGSRSREENDRQPLEFCPECQAKIWWTCAADPVERCRQLLKFFQRENSRFGRRFLEARAEDPSASARNNSLDSIDVIVRREHTIETIALGHFQSPN